MKSRLKLIALIAASVLLCANTAYAGFTPKTTIGLKNGEEIDNEGALDDGTQTEVRGCEDYDDANCPTPAAAEPAPAEESAPPSDEAGPEVEAKPEDEAESEATGEDSDSSEPEDSSDDEDAEDADDPEEDEEDEDEDEDLGDEE